MVNWKKIILFTVGFAYLLLPVDFVPDVPGIGLLDDTIFLILIAILSDLELGIIDWINEKLGR